MACINCRQQEILSNGYTGFFISIQLLTVGCWNARDEPNDAVAVEIGTLAKPVDGEPNIDPLAGAGDVGCAEDTPNALEPPNIDEPPLAPPPPLTPPKIFPVTVRLNFDD